MWNKDHIVNFLYNYDDNKNYAGEYIREYLTDLKRNRHSHRAPFENKALDNAMFDEALSRLTASEEYVLWELYSKDSGVNLTTYWWSEDTIQKIKKETGRNLAWIKSQETCAIKYLLYYLNGGKMWRPEGDERREECLKRKRRRG